MPIWSDIIKSLLVADAIQGKDMSTGEQRYPDMSQSNMIQRLARQDEYPKIQNADGSYSTHLMSFATDDNGAFVYPEIVQKPNTDQLEKLSPRQAMKYGQQQGNNIRFPNEQQAGWFSGNNYKSLFNIPYNKE